MSGRDRCNYLQLILNIIAYIKSYTYINAQMHTTVSKNFNAEAEKRNHTERERPRESKRDRMRDKKLSMKNKQLFLD